MELPCYILLLVVFGILVSLQCHEICPLSSTMDLNNSNSYFYPLDIYAPVAVQTKVASSKEAFPCYGAYYRSERIAYNCSNTRFCPIDSENVIAALSKKVDKTSSLCHLKSKLTNKNEKIRVFVFGGSVTLGASAQWCNSADPPTRTTTHLRCAWPYHFGEWLKHSNAAEVSLYNLARGGHNSYLTSRILLEFMQTFKAFTANDLILLDHSVNDDGPRKAGIERGVESLIRRIYSLSINNSWPSLVLLDANPVNHHYQKGNKMYPLAYQTMAQHYNIPIWSYRLAVWSTYSTTVQEQFNNYLNFKCNYFNSDYRDIHPQWHVHLFIADLYSAIFQTELNQCSTLEIETSTKSHSSPLLLSEPVALLSAELECDAKERPILSMSYNEINSNSSIGQYSIKPRRSWEVAEDRKGRGGFIAELKDSSLSKYMNHSATLTFTLKNSTDLLMRKYVRLVVQMMHLRTYENAGQVYITLCGTKHSKPLDALWPDYKNNRISIPEYSERQIVLADCVNYSHPVIRFSHHIETSNPKVRKKQKFKLISIKVCAMNKS